jgi:hypothetical protein
MSGFNDLVRQINHVYTKIYYLSEKDYATNDADYADLNEAVMALINTYNSMCENDLAMLDSTHQILLNDIRSFWTDTLKMQSKRHAWLIISEYIPVLQVQLGK